MNYKLLISGERASFTTLAFDAGQKTLDLLANYAAPFNASWVEPYISHKSIDCLVGLSEGTESGLLYSFEIDHAQKTCQITSQQPTLGAPAHLILLKDSSAVAVATYMGGSIALYPVSTSEKNKILLSDAPRTEVMPPFPYLSLGHGPDEGRQRQCHIHQIIEDKNGLLYALDLGSDRVWILHGGKADLQVCGWLQCPPGTGPRHAVFARNDKILYVLGELSHTVIAFDLLRAPSQNIPPIDGFSPSIIPPNVHPHHQIKMDSAEICLHPTIPNVLYASNRLERHIAHHDPHIKDIPGELASGDAVAIILLSDDGKKVDSVKHVRTNVDVIRGMRLSNDGKYVVVAGQEGGGIEIYEISGSAGDEWTLAVRLSDGLEGGIKHAIWL